MANQRIQRPKLGSKMGEFRNLTWLAAGYKMAAITPTMADLGDPKCLPKKTNESFGLDEKCTECRCPSFLRRPFHFIVAELGIKLFMRSDRLRPDLVRSRLNTNLESNSHVMSLFRFRVFVSTIVHSNRIYEHILLSTWFIYYTQPFISLFYCFFLMTEIMFPEIYVC